MDFKGELRKALKFLEVSCREYDDGNFDEAIRIGTTLRVLFHHTDKSTSLLYHLGATTIDLLSTYERAGRGAEFHMGITQIRLSPGNLVFEVIPKLGARGSRPTKYPSWWSMEPVYINGRTKVMRRDIVLHAVNKLGGAHVAAALPAEYTKVIDGFGWKLDRLRNGQNESVELQRSHLAPLRQIGYEVLNSPALLSRATDVAGP